MSYHIGMLTGVHVLFCHPLWVTDPAGNQETVIKFFDLKF